MNDRILLVDDEPNVLAALKRVFGDEPYEIVTAESAEKGLEEFAARPFKAVISDERMPGMDGAAFLAIVRERYPEVARILLTGYASIEATMKAVNNGEIYRFFTKPWDEFELKVAVRSAIDKYDLEAENRRLLKTVKRQAADLRALEVKYPGITRLDRSGSGSLLIPEIAEDEVAQIIEECCRDCA